MAALWTAHDRVARDLLRTWRGREIDKTDGMLTVFERVADAVGFALAYHASQARSALDDARSIADESRVGPESELGLALTRVESLLAGAASE